MQIAVISDTHSRFETIESVLALLRQRKVERVLHCGDIEDADTVWLFPGKTHFVFGNCDTERASLRQAMYGIGATLHEPFGQLELDGVKLAFGTDYPVEPVAPFRGLYAAVTRKSEDGKQEYYPAQKLTIEQAIAAYTTGSAYAEFAETQKGTLAPGMLADFVVLDRDLTAIPPGQILGTRVLRTVVGGKTAYESN